MYAAIELKLKKDGTLEVNTVTKETKEQATQAYYVILGNAAVSDNPVHTAILLNEYGTTIKGPETCKHGEDE